MDSKGPSGTKKMKEKFDDREMTTDQLEDVAGGTEVDLQIDPSSLVPGLNNLKLCYDSAVPNWISIDYHRLKLAPPPLGLRILLR